MANPAMEPFCDTLTKGNDLTEGNREAVRLPQELVCAIISHIDDFNTLISCSTTGRMWRAETLPFLPFSFTTRTGEQGPKELRWPVPLLELYELSLLRYVQRLNILRSGASFARGLFDDEHNLRCFSALTHLRELRIDCLEFSSFMPNIGQYFGHFAPSLQSLALCRPMASSRQALYFAGLFPKLQDLKVLELEFGNTLKGETTASLELVPPSQPPLDEWLTLARFEAKEFVNDMITFYGKLRFRCAYLRDVDCTKRVLNECAETLVTLVMVNGRNGGTGKNFFG